MAFAKAENSGDLSIYSYCKSVRQSPGGDFRGVV